MTTDLGGDAHEIGAHRRVVRLRSSLPLQQGDHHRDGGARDDEPPITRPAVRRATESPGSTRGGMALHPEERHPEDEGDENREARVDERPRADIGIHAHPDEEPPREDRDRDADRGTEHPGGKERADDVDLRPHGLPLSIRPGAGVRDLARCGQTIGSAVVRRDETLGGAVLAKPQRSRELPIAVVPADARPHMR